MSTGKVVFGEALPAALAVDGSNYFDKSWRHAAAHVSSPPLRADPSLASYLTDLLAKWVILVNVFSLLQLLLLSFLWSYFLKYVGFF